MSVLVGKKAPSFEAKVVIVDKIVEKFSLKQFLGKKYVVLFFYPKDFTFVCPTELHAFQAALEEFKKRDVEVVACSTDSEFTHLAWLQRPKNQGGIQGVTYPIVSDINKTISDAYGLLAGEAFEDENEELIITGELVAYRGLFLIDKNGIVQHQVVNNMPIGRSVQETLRVVDALQHFEQHGEVCPMDWKRGDKAMTPSSEGLVSYFK
ncbi:MAG: alkyl hydroperoxide reductase [Verrucomicrobia bacterium GWC2_42_7]|nr:MAG: alkyl hydroperoxide reductase [Verrucomicrobia bacterium GWC2_42_7]